VAVALAYWRDLFELERTEMHIPSPQSTDSGYYAPHVELGSDPRGGTSLVLQWTYGDAEEVPVPASSPVLDGFIRLADVPDKEFPERVLAFANKFGVLEICIHGKPPGHSGGRCMANVLLPTPQAALYWEPLEAWRRYSRQMLATMYVAQMLQSDRGGGVEHWQTIGSADPVPPPHSEIKKPRWDMAGYLGDFRGLAAVAGDSPQFQRMTLAAVVNTWLRYGDVRPRTDWWPSDSAMELEMGYAGLSGLLAVQLSSALSAHVHICSGCGRPFVVPEGKRRPKRGYRAWCYGPDCGRLAQFRDYQRRTYKQKRHSKE
jgi:hypothetical protein